MSIIACSVDGCEKITGVKGTARGYCSMHYNRWRRNGDPRLRRRKVIVQRCVIAGCGKPHDAKFLCTAHLTNLRRHGTTSPRKRGEIRNGKKICSSCNRDLPTDKFSPRGDSFQTSCKKCYSNYRSKRYYADHDRQKAIGREQSKKHAHRRRDAQKKRRALVRGATVDHVEALSVYDRDGWTCGICMGSILQEAVWPNPLSPSLDHIIPLSKGGEHSYKNIQSAHLVCNMRKGAELI